jgi:hypothetical protein
MDERDMSHDLSSFEPLADRVADCPALFDRQDAGAQRCAGRPAAQHARLAVAAGHFGELLVPGAALGRLPYLDDMGTVVVLVPREQALPRGQVGLRIAVPGVGQVALVGRFGDFPLSIDRARRVGELLLVHQGCLSGRLDRGGATPRALVLDSILLDTGPQQSALRETAPPEVVTAREYGATQLDLFAELGSAIGTHLSEVHQDLLLAVARCSGLATDPLAVSIAAAEATSVGLEVFDATGSRPVTLRFAAPLTHPHQLATALRALGREPA